MFWFFLLQVMHEKLWFQRGGREDVVVFDTSAGRVAPCICFENHDMGVYLIQDPDGYWIEIVPQRD